MTISTRKTTAALAGAVVLASAGYAIGSTSGDGSATAADRTAARTTAPRGLADRLGVSEDKLRAALEKVREDAAGARDDRRADHAAALAKALGKSTAEVEAALERLHTQRRDAFAAALAKALGVDAEKVKAALEQGGPRELAEELGVSAAKLRSALREAWPERRDRGDHEAELAKALGVTEEQLDAAQEKVREAAGDAREARRKELAAALAKELGIDAAKVEEALGDGPFGFGGHRHGGPGRGGPGGPGFGGHGPR